jgi:hypothetical protein
VFNLSLPDDNLLKLEFRADLLKGLVVLKGNALVNADSDAARKEQPLLAIPNIMPGRTGVMAG